MLTEQDFGTTQDEHSQPDDLQASAERLLEFPRIRQLLAAQTRFFRSHELSTQITPQTHEDDVRRLQEETAEAALMLETVGDIGLTGHNDLRPVLRRAALGGMLDGQELVSVVNLLDSTRLARNIVLSMNGRVPLLEAVANDIPDLGEVRTAVLAAITESGDVRDSATPRLGRLRKDAAQSYQRLVRVLERVLASQDVRGAVQSSNIATRNDRLVIEVRTDSKDAVPGIVHDVSNTGSTLFVEPFRAVDLCNTWRETAAEAHREEERVLRRLSQQIGQREEEAVTAIEAAADIDLITARARLARSMDASRPETLERGADPAVRLFNARHPLLGADAVPVSVSMGPGFRGLVITGPNTGGKTVSLKTMGLFSLMHQCGMQIPASDGSALATFTAVFADIGDAQSIDRSVSTFSSHMGNVIQILDKADSHSLVLLDELGTGTDPEEGSALARAVLSELMDRDTPVAVTTHHRAVAEFAGPHPKIENASVELDAETLQPSYRLIMGIPGRSYAIHVARNLGLPEKLLETAESLLDPRRAEAETLLNQIQRERDSVRDALDKAEADGLAAESARKDLETRLRQVARQQDDLVYKTRMDLRREADDVRRQLRRIVSQAESGKSLATAQRAVNRLKTSLTQPTWFSISESEPKNIDETLVEDKPIAAGDDVEIKGLNVRAKVVSVNSDGMADLQMGNARIQLNVRQLRRLEKKIAVEPDRTKPAVRVSRAPKEPTSGEIDVRGRRSADIPELITAFVDQCAADGRSNCRIIHGSGTGALRQAVRDTLSQLPQASSFEPAPREQGGNGATLVDLG